MELSATVKLVTSSKSGILQRAFARLQTAVTSQLPPSPAGMDSVETTGTVSEVHVSLASTDETLNDQTNETYTLQVLTDDEFTASE